MKPTVIGIGAQKCASSWVHSVLGAHPDIGVSSPKELDFFSYYFDRGYRWYQGHFAHLSDRPIRCDTSPSYFYDPRAAERAWHYDSGLKVVALLRDPVARAYSNHLHEVIKGHIPACSFEEGLAGNPVYVEQGRYHTHLGRWFDVFGPERILVLIAEEIQADPAAAARRLYDFVGARPGFATAVSGEARNVSDRARSPALRSALRGTGELMRRAGLEEQLARIKSAAPVAGLLRANSVDLRTKIPPMAEATRRRLTEIFGPEMLALAQLLSRDSLPWASWSEPGRRADPERMAS